MTLMTITHTITYTVEVEDYLAAGIEEETYSPDEATLPDALEVIADNIPQTEFEELVERWAWHCVKVTDNQITWTVA